MDCRATKACYQVLILMLCLLPACSKKRVIEPPVVSLSSIDPFLRSMIEESRSAILSSPNSAEAWGKYGQALQAAEFTSSAHVCYARAVDLEPHSARWLHLLGVSERADQPEAAIAHLSAALQWSGTNSEPSALALARLLLELGRFEAATEHLNQLLTSNPNHAAARMELGRVLLARGDLDRAVEVMKPALTNAYTARPASLLLSQVLQRQGKTEAASQMVRRAGTLPRPFDWPDPYLREVQSMRIDRARLADQANGLIQQQRLSEGEEVISRLLKAMPDDPEGLLLLGRLRYLQKNCTEAEAALRRHLAVQPSSLNGLIQLGIALLCQRRWNEAVAVLEQATILKPDFAQAHSNLGYARSRAGDVPGAIKAYQNALRCSPGDANAHISLADELIRSGERKEARDHFERARAINPNDPRLAQLQERMEK